MRPVRRTEEPASVNMARENLLLVLVCLVVNCAIAADRECEGGNCTVGSDANETQHNETLRNMEMKAIPTVVDVLTVENDARHRTPAPPIFVTVPAIPDMPKGRAINFTLEGQHPENGLAPNGTAEAQKNAFKDLSDVSMDDEDEDSFQKTGAIAPKLTEGYNATMGICVKGGLTYSNGEKIEDGCETICTCMNGKMDCTDRCASPYFRRGKKINDSLCIEKTADDPCCSLLVCTSDTETEPFEMCSHQNKTYHRGEKFYDGCSQVCSCDAGGKISCKQRCRPTMKTSDRCVEVPDPDDSCCKMVLCDVSLDDHEHKEQDIPKLKLISARFINSSTILLKFDNKLDEKSTVPQVETSSDKTTWKDHKITSEGYLSGVQNDIKYVRLDNTDDYVSVQNNEMQPIIDLKNDSCEFNGVRHALGEEFYDNCTSFCICLDTGVKCLKIQCPTYFGLDVVDPNCIEWETVPADFTPKPPNCCPEKVKCKSNGSCLHEGEMYQNWNEIPINVTGCDKRCYCEMGKVECQSACPPVAAVPPNNLPCLPHEAILNHLPGDDCCFAWMCGPSDSTQGIVDKSKKTDKQRPDNLNVHTVTKNPLISTLSNFTGPLLIYENKKTTPNQTTVNESNDLQNLHSDQDILLPTIKPTSGKPEKHGIVNQFNSFDNSNKNDGFAYQNLGPWNNPIKFNEVPPPKENTPQTPTSFVGPFNPDFKNPVSPVKNKKANKTSINSLVNNKQKVEQPLLPIPQQIPVNQGPQYTNVQPHQNSDEILQIINQHPELANYPPGSVFEIHSYPPDQQPKPTNQQFPPAKPPPGFRRPQPPVGPYLVNQVDSNGQSPNGNFPLNLSIDQILQHVHKGQIPPGVSRPGLYPQNPQFAQNPTVFAPTGLQYSLINQPQLNPNQTAGFGGFPGRFPGPGYQQSPDEITVQLVEAIDGQTVRLIFTVSPLIVGLHGRVEVRYTNKADDNLANWELQVFAPPNDLIATQQLEFDLVGLQPNTEYKIKVTVILRDLHNTPSSKIYTVRTPVQTVPPMIPIEPNLAVLEANATWVNIAWRKLNEYELQFVDGVQLRYKEISGKVYAATPLIHRAVTSYTLENLKPNTDYEVGIFFIPFTGQTTELHSENMVHFTTSQEIDPYGFNVTLEIQQVKATSVEIMWSGVPYPEDKYVNIYRAIYQSDSGKGDFSTFKIAKRDSPTKTVIVDLKPGIRYRLWLEVYLTSGKIKTSNVKDFVTKPRSATSLSGATQQGKLAAGEEIANHSNDYYGPLVVVAILAAIAIISTLILLMILVRRHSQSKAAISAPPRVSQAAYDNPTYKVEIQQETMDL